MTTHTTVLYLLGVCVRHWPLDGANDLSEGRVSMIDLLHFKHFKMINRLHTLWHEVWFSLLFSSILRGVLFTRLSEMASVICALVSDWCVFASIRLQLHLPPWVREPGPVGLQPEGQRAWTNSASQKPLLLHSPSTQGECSKHTKESYFCEEKAFESYLWNFPGHCWRANTFIWVLNSFPVLFCRGVCESRLDNGRVHPASSLQAYTFT